MTMLGFLTGDIEQSVVMSTERGLVTKGPQVVPSSCSQLRKWSMMFGLDLAELLF